MSRTNLTIFFLLICSVARAGGPFESIGSQISPKGAGFTGVFRTAPLGELHCLNVMSDFGGMATGEMDLPGIKITLDNARQLCSGVWDSEGIDYSVYYATGISAGLLRDYERPDHGLMVGVNGKAGAKLKFERGVSLCVEFNADVGLYVRKGCVSIYRNGIYRSYIPELKIVWDL